jgi:hypothetical protein
MHFILLCCNLFHFAIMFLSGVNHQGHSFGVLLHYPSVLSSLYPHPSLSNLSVSLYLPYRLSPFFFSVLTQFCVRCMNETCSRPAVKSRTSSYLASTDAALLLSSWYNYFPCRFVFKHFLFLSMLIFWVISPCGLVVETNLSPEDGGNIFLRNIAIYHPED